VYIILECGYKAHFCKNYILCLSCHIDPRLRESVFKKPVVWTEPSWENVPGFAAQQWYSIYSKITLRNVGPAYDQSDLGHDI
jgi:hypothetical protein